MTENEIKEQIESSELKLTDVWGKKCFITSSQVNNIVGTTDTLMIGLCDHEVKAIERTKTGKTVDTEIPNHIMLLHSMELSENGVLELRDFLNSWLKTRNL